jgi:hypothetical protein
MIIKSKATKHARKVPKQKCIWEMKRFETWNKEARLQHKMF